jgi:DNA-binding transcriptional ArsR family regulator
MQLLDIYRALGHETRLRILSLLTERPLCVRDLQQALQASQCNLQATRFPEELQTRAGREAAELAYLPIAGGAEP